MEIVAFLGFVLTILFLLNYYLHHHWTRHGFPQLEPKFLLGDIANLFLLQESIAEIYGKLYSKNKNHKIIGLYFTYRPGLLVTDTDLIQNILVKDFNHFHDHGLYVDTERDPLSGHLFSLNGEKWRSLRNKLSPLFSPGKLKVMFPTFLSCATNLQEHVKQCVVSGEDIIEIRDLLARYTTDIIASVAFGYENDSINEPDNIFRKMGAKVFKPNLKAGLRALFLFLVPKFNKILGMKIADNDVEHFMFSMVQQTIEYRKRTKNQRNDFMQMMIKLMECGKIDGHDSDETNELNFKLDFLSVTAQAFVFFIAAFETTSSTMALCLYELTKNPELQRKVQKEIDDVFKAETTEMISFDSMSELKYLECCIDETMRKYPPAPFLIRECTKKYHVPGTDGQIIEKGTPVIISSFGLHRDPDIFDQPLTFRPERFSNSPTGSGKGSGLFYLPFGGGPRICIGELRNNSEIK